ncbi:MAG TPA: MGMT family protein [Actinomycetota bacterium]|nr:MGMT family protein [Actinomycetota bacterium]
MRAPGEREEAVLEVAAAIPAGALTTYGDVAQVVVELGLPCTARQVARTLADYGAGVAWWRVVQASGTLAPQVATEARRRLLAEGVVAQGRRVPLRQLRWTPTDPQLRRLAARLRDGQMTHDGASMDP